MGEAKRRGTPEQRKALAIERNEREHQERMKLKRAEWEAMTPAEREYRRKREREAMELMAMFEWFNSVYGRFLR